MAGGRPNTTLPKRFSAAFAPMLFTKQKTVVQDLLARFRNSDSKFAAERGYATLSLMELEAELEGVQQDQLRWVTQLCSNKVTENWLKRYHALFPQVEGILAIEELYEDDVGLAVANVLMVESEKTAQQQQLLIQPQPQQMQQPVYNPAITDLFFQAVIYDSKGDRFLVVDVSETHIGKVYTVANKLEHTRQLQQVDFLSYTKYRKNYQFPSLINRKTDMDSWNAKFHNSKKRPGRIKFREEEFTRFIPDSCPPNPTKADLCVYFRNVMFAKLQFERNNDCDYPVTEEQFLRVWIKRLERDTAFGSQLRSKIMETMGLHVTVTGLIESLARLAKITDGPKTLINKFKQDGQKLEEDIQQYVLRKQKEAKMVLLDGDMEETEMIEHIIRGV